ncbi:MAG TPA: hypothetical protein VKB80_27285 [Kofleriaceae bacterium]|nr:hypothetical protein [Kofleriaceae bacterium]
MEDAFNPLGHAAARWSEVICRPWQFSDRGLLPGPISTSTFAAGHPVAAAEAAET